jgi:ribosomal protein S18 acetylase RimI-like enzyme
MVAADNEDGRPCGALLVVLKPKGYRVDTWHNERPPVVHGAVVPAPSQAHLDWVFVSPWLSNRGVASAMLARTVEALRAAGHASLTSSFMVGNGESMAWHWRNGFELLQYPGSMRTLGRRFGTKLD